MNGSDESRNVLDLGVSWKFWILLAEGDGTFFLNRSAGSASSTLPRLWLQGGLYVRHPFVDGHLDLKAGFRGWYRSAHQGSLLNPEVLAYVPNSGLGLGQAGSVDFVLAAHLGDALFTLVWQNLPNIEYYSSPYYPGVDRTVRFGVRWDFLN
jgi:hypothetical protein